jgi:hypothetical protein
MQRVSTETLEPTPRFAARQTRETRASFGEISD